MFLFTFNILTILWSVKRNFESRIFQRLCNKSGLFSLLCKSNPHFWQIVLLAFLFFFPFFFDDFIQNGGVVLITYTRNVLCYLLFLFQNPLWESLMEEDLVKYLLVSNLCSGVQYVSFGINISVTVGFLYMANCIIFSSFAVATCKKLILFSDSSSMVNCIKGVKTINVLKTLWILVVLPK